MAVYTRRLGVISGTSPSVWLQIFVASSSVTTVMRDVVITNATTAPAGEVALRVRPVTKAGEWWIFYAKPLAIGTTHIELRQVIEPNEAVEVYSTSTGLYVAVTGYVLQP